jgi:hypothetical protein
VRVRRAAAARPQWLSLAHGHYLAALAGYLLLTLLMLGPFLAHWRTAIPGGPIAGVDGYQNVWNLWWVERALRSGQNPFVSGLIFYPQGAPLYLQTLNITNALLGLPITTGLGPVAAYNAIAVLAFALCGIGGYALTLRESGSRAAALLGGVIFAFGPFHVAKLWDGQLELVAAQWLALYALLLLRALTDGRRGEAILAGLVLALVAYTSWYYALFAAVLSLLLVALWWPAGGGRRAAGSHLGRAALVGAVGAALILPVLAMAATAEHRALGAVDAGEVLTRSANLLDYLLPSYLHPLWGEAVGLAVSLRWERASADWNVALGYTAIALAAVGVVGDWRRAWRWLAVLLTALILSLGPVLQVGPWNTGIPLPYALIAALPGLSLGRRPFLFAVLVLLALAVLAALGARLLLARTPARARIALLGVLLLLLAGEYLPRPWPVQPAAVHPIYQTLAQGQGAVLELPPPVYKRIGPQRAQIVHGRPIFGGYLARAPIYPLVDEAAVLRDLWATSLGLPHDPSRVLIGPEDPLAALRAYGVRDIVVHWDTLAPSFRPELTRALTAALPGVAPTFVDDTLSVYTLPAGPPTPVAFFGSDWHPEEREGARRWRWMGAQGTLTLTNPGTEAAPLELELDLLSYAEPRELSLALGEAALGRWSVDPAGAALRLRLLVPPGEHVLRLSAPAAREERSGRELSVVVTGATARWRPSGE